jgi:hypothetical protein
VEAFAEALAAVKNLKDEGIVAEYAVGGAMALAFWAEPTATYDLDVFVLFRAEGMLIDLGPIYVWAEKRGYKVSAEHIMIAGIPVQIIPAPTALVAEAVARAVDLDYDGLSVRVITPEYLIGLYLEPSARTEKRLARVAGLMEEANVDRDLLNDILARYNLKLPTSL